MKERLKFGFCVCDRCDTERKGRRVESRPAVSFRMKKVRQVVHRSSPKFYSMMAGTLSDNHAELRALDAIL